MSSNKEVVIIGAGVIGLFCAYYLRKAGHSVTIVEKEDVGSGSSMSNAGYVCPSHIVPLAAPGMITQGLKWMLKSESPFYIRPRPDPALLAWLWRFARAGTHRHVSRAAPLLRDLSLESEHLYRLLSEEPGLDFGYQRRGLLMLYQTEHARHSAVAAAGAAVKLGISARVLSSDDLRALEPGVEYSVSGGVYYPGDGHLVPERLISSLRAHLEAQGVSIQTSAAVVEFDRRSSGIAGIRTADGEIRGDEFVLAAGAWSSALARSIGLHIPMQPGRGYSITMTQPLQRMTIPAILEEARVAVTPFARTIRFAGTMELSGFSTPPSQKRIDAILRAVPKYLRNVMPVERKETLLWHGYRPCSPDGLPYIGRFRSVGNLIAATGHAMLGTSLGPVTGKLVADLVDGTPPPIDLTLTHPERFR
jgi:D-amino-acid dehydrogenase